MSFLARGATCKSSEGRGGAPAWKGDVQAERHACTPVVDQEVRRPDPAILPGPEKDGTGVVGVMRDVGQGEGLPELADQVLVPLLGPRPDLAVDSVVSVGVLVEAALGAVAAPQARVKGCPVLVGRH